MRVVFLTDLLTEGTTKTQPPVNEFLRGLEGASVIVDGYAREMNSKDYFPKGQRGLAFLYARYENIPIVTWDEYRRLKE